MTTIFYPIIINLITTLMKKIFTAIIAAVALLTATSAQAQIKFGLKGGLNVTNMSFSRDVVDKSNRTGFFVGPMVKVTIPLAGLGLDAGVLYDQREAEASDEGDKLSVKQRSINIPINLRYNFGFSSLVGAYVAAGPQFGFAVGDKSFQWDEDVNYDVSKTNFSVNVGAGVTLFSHLEVGFTYNIACGKTGEVNVWDVASSTWNQVTRGRANAWQVSAAYWF